MWKDNYTLDVGIEPVNVMSVGMMYCVIPFNDTIL
mgnify:CR=1 FL=1